MTTLEKDKQYLIQCYTTDDIVFTKGRGMYLYDDAGKKYLDFSGQFYDVIKDVRGRGLLQGFEIEGSSRADKFVLGQELYETMLKKGLITELESRKNLENVVIVMHPALITSKEHVDEAIAIIDRSLESCLK